MYCYKIFTICVTCLLITAIGLQSRSLKVVDWWRGDFTVSSLVSLNEESIDVTVDVKVRADLGKTCWDVRMVKSTKELFPRINNCYLHLKDEAHKRKFLCISFQFDRVGSGRTPNRITSFFIGRIIMSLIFILLK